MLNNIKVSDDDPMKRYQIIVKDIIYYPKDIHKEAKSLIKLL